MHSTNGQSPYMAKNYKMPCLNQRLQFLVKPVQSTSNQLMDPSCTMHAPLIHICSQLSTKYIPNKFTQQKKTMQRQKLLWIMHTHIQMQKYAIMPAICSFTSTLMLLTLSYPNLVAAVLGTFILAKNYKIQHIFPHPNPKDPF